MKSLLFLLAAPEVTEGYNYWHEFVNMLISLGVILLIVIVAVWGLKRVLRSRAAQLNKTTRIKILERRALGPKAALYLIDVAGKALVISESPQGIHTITEFPEGTDFETLLEEEKVKKPTSFKNILRKKMENVAHD